MKSISHKFLSLFFVLMLGMTFVSCEVEDIRMPDFEVGIVASATIAPDMYFFNAQNLPEAAIQFDLAYDGFGVHEASSIELYLNHAGQQVTYGTYTSFPTTIRLSAADAYALFERELPASVNREEFAFTYKLTTTTGLEFSEFGQYYTYNPSTDGRFTGRFGQFGTNLPGFGRLIFDVRNPNPLHPNEN